MQVKIGECPQCGEDVMDTPGKVGRPKTYCQEKCRKKVGFKRWYNNQMLDPIRRAKLKTRNKRSYMKMYESRKEAGLCPLCGGMREEDGPTFCANCVERCHS